MKQIAFVAVASGLLAGLTATAQGPVYSVNIVGFQKVTGSTAYTQTSNPFVKGGMTLDEVIGDQLTGGTDPDSSDNILYWNGAAYERYFKAAGTGDPAVDGKWFDEGLNPAGLQMLNGRGVWIKNNHASQTVTMVGDVVADATKSVTINPGYNMISYPYSTTIAMTSASFIGLGTGAQGGTDPDSADNIFFWNGTTYVKYFLANGTGDPNVDGKWFDEGLNLATLTIEPGQAFWYKRNVAGSITWTVNKPY